MVMSLNSSSLIDNPTKNLAYINFNSVKCGFADVPFKIGVAEQALAKTKPEDEPALGAVFFNFNDLFTQSFIKVLEQVSPLVVVFKPFDPQIVYVWP